MLKFRLKTPLGATLLNERAEMNEDLGNSNKEWQELGFRSGLEIHHQIVTEKKLFCHCPSGLYSNEYHAQVLRHMRPTMSELGEYDGTALMEFKTRKQILYRLNRESVCSYEMDDTPPFPVNDEAVDKALSVAQAFNCKIVGEMHVIRKQYLDGSIPTGFQRTAIVGVDGVLPLSSGKEVQVVQVSVEEDSCREISDVGHHIIFQADRLGMPLIEVVTAPALLSPNECAEAAMRIGRMLRATGLVRRGLGAGRQDVNLSIEGGPRVEIKGVPQIPRIPELLAYEARRQHALLKIRDELHDRGYNDGDRPGSIHLFEGAADSFESPHLTTALMTPNGTLRIVKLPNATGLVSYPIGNDNTFAKEFSGRVRVVACLDNLPNIFHTDGASGGLSGKDSKLLCDVAECGENDVAVAVWGIDADSRLGAEEILDRWAEAIVGIPMETRQAKKDNTTDFERVLPGPDRMYPDTDSPPYRLTEERIIARGKILPEAPWDREARYSEMGLPEDMIYRLAIDEYAELFDELVEAKKVKPIRAAEVLTRLRVALRRKGIDTSVLSIDQWRDLLTELGEGKVTREVLPHLLKEWCRESEKSLSDLLSEYSWIPLQDAEVQEIINEAVRYAKELRPDTPEVHHPISMEFAMNRLLGKLAGTEVSKLLDSQL